MKNRNHHLLITMTVVVSMLLSIGFNGYIIVNVSGDPPITECNDGIDNDGDGLVDWQYDCGCWGPEDDSELAEPREDENGWTTFDPVTGSANPDDDTRVIYVSSSEGDDANDGLGPDTPKATIAEGYSLLRTSYPDWLLLKRGDIWNVDSQISLKHGPFDNGRQVISSYGLTDERPKIVSTANQLFYSYSPINAGRVAITDLDLLYDIENGLEYRNTSGAVTYKFSGEGFILEGCRFTDFGNAPVGIERIYNAEAMRDVSVRRNVLDNTYRCSIFISRVDDILIEGNLFHNAGVRREAENPDLLVAAQTIYVQDDNGFATVRENIFGRTHSSGLQLRSNGTVENNFFIQTAFNNIGSYRDEYPRSASALDNVVLDGKDMGNFPRGNGLIFENLDDSIATGNIVANRIDEIGASGVGRAYTITPAGTGVDNFVFTDNIAYDWDRSFVVNDDQTVSRHSDITVSDNVLWSSPQQPAVSLIQTVSVPNFSFSYNSYHPDSFRIGSTYMSFPEWVDATGDTGSEIINEDPWNPGSDPKFGDEPSIRYYYEYLTGQPGGYEDFMVEAIQQSRFNWRPEYTADAVNDYIREGFEIEEPEESPECNDGIDNDGDGLVDWQYDCGCSDANDTTERGLYTHDYLIGDTPNSREEENGWTTFDPSEDTRIVLVTNNPGQEEDDICASYPGECEVYSSITEAKSRIRDAYPDWLLFKRGDVWNEPVGSWTKSGRSDDERVIIASYGGSTERPFFKPGDHSWLSATWPVRNHIAILGIHMIWDTWLESFNTYGPTGITWTIEDTDNLLIEDCKIERFRCAIGAHPVTPNYEYNNFEIRRNVMLDAMANKTYRTATTFFAGIDDFLFEENYVFSSRESQEVYGTMVSHNLYLADSQSIFEPNVTLRGNVFYNGEVNNYMSRTAGLIEDCLSIRAPFHFAVGTGKAPPPDGYGAIRQATVRNNVAIESRWARNDTDIYGIDVSSGIGLSSLKNSSVYNNIVAHNSDDTSSGVGFVLSQAYLESYNIDIHNNIVYDWDGSDGGNSPNAFTIGDGDFSDIKIYDNQFQMIGDGGRCMRYLSPDTADVTFSGNRYFSTTNPLGRFEYGHNNYMNYSEWVTASDETGSVFEEIEYIDPDRTIGTYHESLDKEGTTFAFLQEARNQSRFNWQPEYTAYVVNDYIREGFEIIDSGSNDPPVFSDESPSDGATDVSIDLPALSVTIEDHEGDSIDWTIETSPNVDSNSGAGEGNGSKSCSVSELNYATQYTWFVNATDGENWTREVYTFTTEDAANTPPVVGDIPDQTIVDEEFVQISLDDYVTDAEDSDEDIIWSYSGNDELEVSIVERVATLNAPYDGWYGQETISFTATDTGDLSDSDNAVFTVEKQENDDDSGGGGGGGSGGGGSDGGSSGGGGSVPPVQDPEDDPNLISVTGGPYSGLVNQTIFLNGSLSAPKENITSYLWDFGDGSNGSGELVNHTYNQTGNFTVTLTIIDLEDRTDVNTTYVNITEDNNELNETEEPEKKTHIINQENLQGKLIDTDNNGVYDQFFNDETGEITGVIRTNDGESYLIDADDDGIWDYMYDPALDSVTQYREINDNLPKDIPWIWISIGFLGLISLAGIAIYIWKIKNPY